MQKLNKASVDSPRRDCLVLVEDLLEKDRSWVTAHAEFELSKEQITLLDHQIAMRVKREPLAYIRGKAWFYGRFFEVNSHVMIPRPESESFISLLRNLDSQIIIDMGTGSGCLAITAKLEFPDNEVIAVDNSNDALGLAEKNAKKHAVDIEFIHSDLLSSQEILQKISDTTKKVTILANLPYVPDGLITSPEIKYEPTAALFSGKDGMEHYKKFWKELMQLPYKPSTILVESLETQHNQQIELARKAGYELANTDILVQHYKKKVKQ